MLYKDIYSIKIKNKKLVRPIARSVSTKDKEIVHLPALIKKKAKRRVAVLSASSQRHLISVGNYKPSKFDRLQKKIFPGNLTPRTNGNPIDLF